MIFSACAYHNEYPNDWSIINLTPTDECPIISGIYLNEGEAGSHYNKISLSSILFAEETYKQYDAFKEASHVLISQIKEEIVEIKVLNNDKEIYSEVFKRKSDQFYCEEGLLKIKRSEFTSRDGAVGQEREKLGLKVADDYLIIKSESKHMGMLFFIPAIESGTSWYRFMQENNKI